MLTDCVEWTLAAANILKHQIRYYPKYLKKKVTQDHFVWVYTWNWFDRDHFILHPSWEHVIPKPPSTACCQQRCEPQNTEAQEPVRDHFRDARTEAGQQTPGAASVHPTPSCHSHPGCLRFAHFSFLGIWNSSALQTPPHTRDREHCLCSGNVHASFRSAACDHRLK